MNKITLGFSITALVLAVLFVAFQSQLVIGSATDGLATAQAMATTTTVGPSDGRITIFNANDTCTSRVITTKATAIALFFGDPTNGDLASTTLTGVNGHIQAASTSVMYDSGLYGCDKWTGYAAASTTITVSEFR